MAAYLNSKMAVATAASTRDAASMLSPLSRAAAIDVKRKAIEDDEECTPTTKRVLVAGLTKDKQAAYREAAQSYQNDDGSSADDSHSD
jgi:hypothetical protein